MTDFHEYLGDKFPGNLEIASDFMSEIKIIRSAINSLDRMTRDSFSLESQKKIRKALATSYAELVAEIEVPITSKFPSLYDKY